MNSRPKSWTGHGRAAKVRPLVKAFTAQGIDPLQPKYLYISYLTISSNSAN